MQTKPDDNAQQRPAALVTGASRGIGRAIALMLAAEGWDLLIVSRGRNGLEETRDLALREGADECRIVVEDLGDPEAPSRIVARAEEVFGRLDLLVNNAGAVAAGPLGGYDLETWNRVMNLNARAPFFLMQKALPLLRAARPGRIVNIGSVVSKKGYAGQALYAASKHALLGMTKSAARDLAADGIRVHAVLPGGVDTDMVRDVRPDIDGTELISPEEIAGTVAFLLSMGGNAIVDEIDVRRFTKPAWD